MKTFVFAVVLGLGPWVDEEVGHSVASLIMLLFLISVRLSALLALEAVFSPLEDLLLIRKTLELSVWRILTSILITSCLHSQFG